MSIHNLNQDQFADQGRPDAFYDQFRGTSSGYLLHDYRAGQVVAWKPKHDAAGKILDPRTTKQRPVGMLTHFGGKVRRNEDGTLDDSSNINGGMIYKVQVKPAHQRKGIASDMLDMARQLRPDLEIRHSHALTEDGAAWAKAKP